jgi:hypothetical protein
MLVNETQTRTGTWAPLDLPLLIRFKNANLSKKMHLAADFFHGPVKNAELPIKPHFGVGKEIEKYAGEPTSRHFCRRPPVLLG